MFFFCFVLYFFFVWICSLYLFFYATKKWPTSITPVIKNKEWKPKCHSSNSCQGREEGPNFGSERTVELICGKLLLTETTTCFSICERRSPFAREILFCEQRRTDHRGIPQNKFSEYPWNIGIVAKSNARFIKQTSQLKSDIRSCRCKNFSLNLLRR